MEQEITHRQTNKYTFLISVIIYKIVHQNLRKNLNLDV